MLNAGIQAPCPIAGSVDTGYHRSPGCIWYSLPEMMIWQTSELPSAMVNAWQSLKLRSTTENLLSPLAP